MPLTMRRVMPRAAGVLLHVTSLPGRFGIGDLGEGARAFVDWLAAAGATLWQLLPLVPTGAGGSPYSSWAAFGGNPDLVDLTGLCRLGLLAPADVRVPPVAAAAVNYPAVRALRRPLLDRAVSALLASPRSPLAAELERFRGRSAWVEDAALFVAVKERLGGRPWWDWPAALRDREPAAVDDARRELAPRIDAEVTLQFLFEHQWQALRAYAAQKGVQLLGDLPIYVDADSVDAWANRELFELGPGGRPARVSGVPPDAFSATGQRWGNPLYRWQRLAADDFAWWRARFARALELTDWVRIDHFRGLSAYWAVPADAPDARQGTWLPGPNLALFAALERVAPALPIVAEDLGIIDDDVRALLAATGLPGMLVLQFAFGEDAMNPYLPHNHRANAVVYTGTHDNDTTLGWWHAQPERVRHHVRSYLGVDGHDVVWDLIRAALRSVASFAVVPMQDVLALGSDARMNTPAITAGNWRWRLRAEELRAELAERFRGLARLYGRLPRDP